MARFTSRKTPRSTGAATARPWRASRREERLDQPARLRVDVRVAVLLQSLDIREAAGLGDGRGHRAADLELVAAHRARAMVLEPSVERVALELVAARHARDLVAGREGRPRDRALAAARRCVVRAERAQLDRARHLDVALAIAHRAGLE